MKQQDDFTEFVRHAFEYAQEVEDVYGEARARDIYNALHYALDWVGVGKGEERLHFLNGCGLDM